MKHSISSLDASIDDIQAELDNKTYELQETREKCEKQMFEFSNM